MKRILLFILIIVVPFTCLNAQKKELSTAADQVKSGKNLAQAEKTLVKLLEDPENKTNQKIHKLLHSAIQKQYEQMNEKMYLKQSIDTASMFLTLHKVFSYAFMTDSIDESFRKKNDEYLSKYIPNLYSGGMWFFEKKKYKEAYEMFDMYLSCKNAPLLKKGQQKITHEKPAAFRALSCGFRLGDYYKTVKYMEQALIYKAGRAVSFQYLAETYQRNDSTYGKYIAMLDSGFREFPCEEYFYTNLINHHISKQELQSALEIVDNANAKCPGREWLYYIKANILLNEERYEECIAAADSTIALTNDNAEIFYIAGMANYYHADIKMKEAENNGVEFDATPFLETAMKHFEEYRQLCPDRKDRWGTPLYHIYLNLNKGDEFEEISTILKQ